MNPQNKWLKVAGVVLNVLVAALMLFAGSMKVFGFAPPEMLKKMNEFGLGDRLLLIGCGEMLAAVLLLIPWTSPLGGLVTSGFWGGVICINMAHNQDFIFPSVLLALTWVGSYLRGSLPLLWMKPGVPVSRRIPN
jgi:DoxX-like family